MKPGDRQWVIGELARCKTDPGYLNRYLKVNNRKGSLVGYAPNDAQSRLGRAMARNRLVKVLKSRRQGISLGCAMEFFKLPLLTAGWKHGVIAHTKDAADRIAEYYRTAYKNLPVWFQAEVRLVEDNDGVFAFSHGGRIEIMTARSDSARGAGFNSLHLSECAFYENPERYLPAIMNTLAPGSVVVKETTANGFNEYYDAWVAEDGYSRLFLSWRDDPAAVSNVPRPVPTHIRKLAKAYPLTRRQAWWASWVYVQKCSSNWQIFDGEYPISEEVAFVASGSRALIKSWPKLSEKDLPLGAIRYHQPAKRRVYTMGVDTAGGTIDGDFSAWWMLDVTDPQAPFEVSTFYDRMRPGEFKALALAEARVYEPLAVIELTGGWGAQVQEHFEAEGYPWLWRRTAPAKMGDKTTSLLGWQTGETSRALMFGRLVQYVDEGRLEVRDVRLQHELNTLVNDGKRIEHADGKHDDGAAACSMALMGIDQVMQLAEQKKRKPPTSIREVLEWEAVNDAEWNGQAYDSQGNRIEEPGLGDAWGML